MRAAQLEDEELAFLIHVGRIIRQCRLANQNAALLGQVLSEKIAGSMDKIQGDIIKQGNANVVITYKRWLKPLR